MNRKLIIVLACAVLLMLGASAAWFVAANRFEAELDAWIVARRADGIDLRYETRRISGFPLNISATFASPTVVRSADSKTTTRWTWKAPVLKIGYRLFTGQLVLSSAGPHDIQILTAAEKHELHLETTALDVSLPLYAGAERHLTLDAAGAKLTVDEPALLISASEAHVEYMPHAAAPGDHLQNAADADVSLKQLSAVLKGKDLLPSAMDWHATASLMGALQPGPLKDSVPAWRDNGGTIEISHLDMHSGEIDMKGSGTLALDSELRVIGALSVIVHDYDQALDKLVATGRVAEKDATLARLMLATMAQADPATGKPTLNIPLSAQDGWMYVGPVRLIKLGPFHFD
jgi:hypothetical protein